MKNKQKNFSIETYVLGLNVFFLIVKLIIHVNAIINFENYMLWLKKVHILPPFNNNYFFLFSMGNFRPKISHVALVHCGVIFSITMKSDNYEEFIDIKSNL